MLQFIFHNVENRYDRLRGELVMQSNMQNIYTH